MLDWYTKMKVSCLMVSAAPHYVSTCPKCNQQVVLDLKWELRGGDPTVWAETDSGQKISAEKALRDPKSVSAWHSREGITCPSCKQHYYIMVTQNMKPVVDFEPKGTVEESPVDQVHEMPSDSVFIND